MNYEEADVWNNLVQALDTLRDEYGWSVDEEFPDSIMFVQRQTGKQMKAERKLRSIGFEDENGEDIRVSILEWDYEELG